MLRHRFRLPALAGAWCLSLLLAACGGASGDRDTAAPLTLQESATQYAIGDGRSIVELDRAQWRLRWRDAGGAELTVDATPSGAMSNPDYARFNDKQDGIDKAYPGLPTITDQPFAYLAGETWHAALRPTAVTLQGREAIVAVQTDDGAGATLTLRFADDGTLRLRYAPKAAGVTAVSTVWQADEGDAWFGGGQRFSGFNLRDTALPLWISHGPGANREGSTNEIAAPFFWCPCGWGAALASDARGEIVFARRNERDDAVRATIEDDALDLVYYRGTPAQMLSAHTARVGRPQWTPPDWMWRPMVWQDSDTSTESVRKLVDGMIERDIPLGAVWLDNPWDAGKASFDFDPARFDDADALIREVHDKGVRFMVWLSPFVSGDAQTLATQNGWTVTGTRADGNDATYYPTRGIDTHLDFTNAAAYAWWRDGLRRLIERGVDGVKVDRGEEDLSDDSVWANGLPNRLNHNAYVGLYHKAIYDAFAAARPSGDFAIFARGGWNGSAQWAGHWAADNTSLLGELGLTQALRSLLSLSVSGFAFNGSDIGGYAGARQDLGEAAGGIPLLPPTEATYIRWTQLGALSPIMQTPVPPWWVSARAVTVYRRYATLHDRLVPYIAAAARRTIADGTPIVRPLPYAYPDDADAVAADDEYLFGDDLLVAPATTLASGLPLSTRRVYLPAGRWRDFWSGAVHEGPQTRLELIDLETLPLYVRDGAELPTGVTAGELP
ncbi:TIM-barrel domain-containing protein [Solimonas flava]|uniref:TIM-barrel domain-containing protein n=1 Tax=Solimonas flava TaxID=415849 RepID=UPI0003F71465|nr:TIM-barrel domain-containing protein [Solimonas flava]